MENHAYEGQSGFSRYLILLAETGKKLKINLKHQNKYEDGKDCLWQWIANKKLKQSSTTQECQLLHVSHVISIDIFSVGINSEILKNTDKTSC